MCYYNVVPHEKLQHVDNEMIANQKWQVGLKMKELLLHIQAIVCTGAADNMMLANLKWQVGLNFNWGQK